MLFGHESLDTEGYKLGLEFAKVQIFEYNGLSLHPTPYQHKSLKHSPNGHCCTISWASGIC